jgi:hypothetical protein
MSDTKLNNSDCLDNLHNLHNFRNLHNLDNLHNPRLSRSKSTINLRINTELQDWTNREKNEKINYLVINNVSNSPVSTSNSIFSQKDNFLNKSKLNSKKSLFVFPTPNTTQTCPHSPVSNPNENIYQDIKDSMINILNQDSTDKKYTMIDKIVKLFQDSKIDRQTLVSFLSTL